jgi:hypothetical protein
MFARPGEPEPNARCSGPVVVGSAARFSGEEESTSTWHRISALVPRWAPERGSEELQGAVLAPLVGTDTIYGVSLASPPQAFERLSWQIWAPLAVYIGAEVATAAFMFRELSVTVVPGDVDASAAAGPAKLSALAMIVVAMIVFLEMVFIFFAFD